VQNQSLNTADFDLDRLNLAEIQPFQALVERNRYQKASAPLSIIVMIREGIFLALPRRIADD
jgi:hypothetical protein